ncbi:hypothetical protein Cgig2_010826 [Carnegiea gigantea]|uniref:Uncharacterized protein n=1 Tax=Carnegiea gigantea TaxID=171969 RepID=A0A9Q1GVY1_9CARY|nr:hypothetical protein Cgig2_010826 [Carnegiea gigantea]
MFGISESSISVLTPLSRHMVEEVVVYNLRYLSAVDCIVSFELQLQSMGACRDKKGESSRKMESRKRCQRLSTLEEEECWRSRSGSDYHPKDFLGEGDGPLSSLVEEGDVDLSSGEKMEGSKAHRHERKKVPIEGKGRYKRCRAAGDGVVAGDDPVVRVLVGPDPILYRRATLDIVVEFMNRLRPLYVEAIKGTTLKPTLQCRSFGLCRELTLALVRQWVPHRRAFRIGEAKPVYYL